MLSHHMLPKTLIWTWHLKNRGSMFSSSSEDGVTVGLHWVSFCILHGAQLAPQPTYCQSDLFVYLNLKKQPLATKTDATAVQIFLRAIDLSKLCGLCHVTHKVLWPVLWCLASL